MLRERIDYVDFNGVKRQEYFWFNYTEAEIQEMNLRASGGLSEKLERISQGQDANEMVTFFKELILNAYGIKSEDGRSFIKNQELRDAFMQTAAYNKLFMTLTTNEKEAIRFISSVIPEVKEPVAAQAVADVQPVYNVENFPNRQLQHYQPVDTPNQNPVYPSPISRQDSGDTQGIAQQPRY